MLCRLRALITSGFGVGGLGRLGFWVDKGVSGPGLQGQVLRFEVALLPYAVLA